MTWEEAIAELRRLVDADVQRAVRQFAAEKNVTPEVWLSKCTIDVSFRILKGMEGEEVIWECKARKRPPETTG